MARCDIRAGRICNAERGRATRRFWASPVVTVDDADGFVAGCSPQFRAAHLRSQNFAAHAIACQHAGYDACSSTARTSNFGAVVNVLWMLSCGRGSRRQTRKEVRNQRHQQKSLSAIPSADQCLVNALTGQILGHLSVRIACLNDSLTKHAYIRFPPT